MLDFADMLLGDVLYESSNSIVYRATRRDGTSVIVKLPPEEVPSYQRFARMQREYEMTELCSGDGTIRALDFTRVGSRFAMVLQDIDGHSLGHYMATGQLPDIPALIEFASKAAAALGSIHGKRVMHKDISPGNIVWNQDDGTVKILDFGIATKLSRENPSVVSPNVLEGTLAYMSPEQTGRMNRALDYRTDLYSLGATLYHLFTGRPPFAGADAMGLVHAHIAQVPRLASELSDQVPVMVARIIAKLMAKNAEDRYQSSSALRADLDRCSREMHATGTIAEFALGQTDISEHFQIPQKLYGRDTQIAHLLQAFERASAGDPEVVLVVGYSGIGKSALVHEVHKPIVRTRGHFITGKFDQFNRNIPYASLIQAFEQLVGQLLTESDARLAAWRRELQTALGQNGQVIVDVIPDIELIIGPQPKVPELAPAEAQNRFHMVFARLVGTFAGEDHPLTLFLDDLQWADSASLKLIRQFTTDPDTRYLFLIGAYRDNEVSPTHPLMLTLDEMRQDGAAISSITLAPLSREHVGQLVAETMHRDRAEIAPLIDHCLQKTGGNPFFLSQFLRAVYEDGGINLDRERNVWDWDERRMADMAITENVVELMAGKIRKLPGDSQHVLRLAACIGASFDLNTLAIVNQDSALVTANHLWPSIEAGLILPVGGEYRFLQENADNELGSPQRIHYRWLHDRVQQAAYSLVGEHGRQVVHGQVGRLMLEKLSPEERSEKLFEIVNHLNAGAPQLSSQRERDDLAALNLRACRKAIATAAYEPAWRFAEQGLQLLSDDAWESAYSLALDLHTEAAAAANLIPDFALMDRYSGEVIARARTVMDKVRAYEIRILASQAQAKVQEGIATALEILALLGVSIPDAPGPDDVGRYLQRANEAVGERAIEQLLDVPENTDPAQIAAIRILVNITSTAYIGAPTLFPLIVLEAVAISAAHGDTGATAYAYVTYGIILCGVLEQFDAGYRFGELGQKIIEKYNAQEYAARTFYIPNCFVRFWKQHARVAWAAHPHTYQLGLQTGDQEFAAWPLMMRTHQGFFMGLPLPGRIEEARNYVDACFQLKQEPSGSYAQCTLQAMLNLIEGADDPCKLTGEVYDEDLKLAKYKEASEAFGICNLYVIKIVLCFLFGQHRTGIELVEPLEPWMGSMTSTLHVPVLHFYDSLNRLAVYREADEAERATLLARVDESIARMRNWAEHCPENYRHKYLLMTAERAVVVDQANRAISLFRQGIDAARQHDYLHEEALGNELAGQFWLGHGDATIAGAFLTTANNLYAQWGAKAKLEHLDARFGRLIKKRAASKGVVPSASSTVTATSSQSIENLDLMSVLKASQAISSEVELKSLLRTVTAIVIENGGADHGCVLFELEGQLRIAAIGNADASGVMGPDDIAVDIAIGPFELVDPVEGPRVPVAAIQYVSRTGEPLVLDDAVRSERFASDPYVTANRPLSLLVEPIKNKGKVTGILYLENKVATGAFTEDRLAVLDILTAQVAISLENARLYAGLQALTEAQSRFVPYQFLESLDRRDIAQVGLGDYVAKEMTVMFCDLRGFTPLSERLGPRGVIALLNRYFAAMEVPIFENGGFIDSYNGDEIMALFDVAPDRAVRAAISMRRALETFNDNARKNGEPELEMGIGLNTGELLLGTVGGRDRIKCGVVGDPVNLAARVEQLTKRYGAPVLIGEGTWDRLERPQDFSVRVVNRVAVKGKEQANTLYEVLDGESEDRKRAKEASRPALTAGFDKFYARDFAGAVVDFETCLTFLPDDPLPPHFIERCRRYLAHPPAQDWNGVERLQSKR